MSEDRLDPHAAAELLARTGAQSRRSLDPRTWQLYAAWAVAWFGGFGAMWLSVRGQQPYRGPSVVAAVLLGALMLAAVAVTLVVVRRATRGVEGRSAAQGRMYAAAWPIGFAAVFALQGALAHHGAGAAVLGIVGATGPMLVTSLVYLVGAATWQDRPMFVTGAWLALVAALGAWSGPVGVLLLGSLAGAAGFAAMAAYVARAGRS